jgi:multidrug efflux pump subunit AcrB
MESSKVNLVFDKKILSTWFAKYLKQTRLVVLFLITILAVGIASFSSLPRRLNPEVKLTIVSVSTVLPGAGPSDVEKLITIPLEDKIKNVENIDTLTSTSANNASFITIQFLSNTDQDKARTDVQTAVSEVQAQLPEDALSSNVVAFDFENQPVWQFTLSASGDYASLMRYSNSLKDSLEDIAGIDTVALSGYDQEEIQIRLSEEKLRQYSISPIALSSAISQITKSYPSGSVASGDTLFALSIDQEATDIEGIRNTKIIIDGVPVALGDIATVVRASKNSQDVAYIASKDETPVPTVLFSVFKEKNSDIDTTAKLAEEFVHEKVDETDGTFKITTVSNAGDQIGEQFTDLFGEFSSTLLLLFINLFLFLGLRQAFLASLTIPLTFLFTFAWMSVFGQTINFISLFGLLLALGTSIDDTIVTISAITTYHRSGKLTPYQTAVLVWRDFVTPIWTTTITTVWAFIPLLLATGIIGEFIKPIPIVVATAMYTSTFIAWFITLPIMIIVLEGKLPRRVRILFIVLALIAGATALSLWLPKNVFLIIGIIGYLMFVWGISALFPTIAARLSKNKKLTNAYQKGRGIVEHGVINTRYLGAQYRKLILRLIATKASRVKTLVLLAVFAIAAYILVPLGLVKNEFFPKTNEDTLYVSLELSQGTSKEKLIDESLIVLDNIRKTSETSSVLLQTNADIPGNEGTSSNESRSLFTLNLIPSEERNYTSSQIAEQLRDRFDGYVAGKIVVQELSGGPPAGSDIAIKLSGADLSKLQSYAQDVSEYLKSVDGTVNVSTSISSGPAKLVFVPDHEQLLIKGVSKESVAFALRVFASGFTLDTVNFDEKDEDIVLFTSTDLKSPEQLGEVMVTSNKGEQIPLLSLGKIILSENPTSITREDGKRTITVSAGLLPGFNAGEIGRALEVYAGSTLALNEGYSWSTGGVNEENQKSVISIIQAMGLSFILIMATMVIEFKSYRQAAIILSLIPFSISGVFYIFGLSGTPLSFPALIGILALFGIVVTNAMFIMEKINQNIANKMNITDAIADAGESRLEPIMLTSLTSILGLVPITLGNPLWRGLGGAIISGLLFSGIIMLIFIPVVYYSVFAGESKKNTRK